MLASVLSAAAVLSAMPLTASAVEPVPSDPQDFYYEEPVGSSDWVIYTEGDAPSLSRDVKMAFSEAAASYNGGKVEPVLLYATGIVSGVNYSFIIREYNDDGTAVLKEAVIYDPNHVNSTQRTGKARFSLISDFDPEDYQKNSGYHLPEEPTVGGSGMERFSACDLPEDVDSVFSQATDEIEDLTYQPVAYLGTKTTDEGTLYAVMCCKYNPYEELSDRFLDVVTILKGTDGTCSVKYSYSIYGKRYKFPNQFKNLCSFDKITIYKGQAVRVNLAASGGTGDYQYTVAYRKMNTGKWIEKTYDSSTTSVLIKPSAVCTYEVTATVYDGKSERSLFTYVWVNEKLVNTTTVSDSTIRKGQTVTVNCSSTGGSGAKKYAVYYKKKNSSTWNVAQKFSKNTNVSIKPLAATDYDICVKVQDDHGLVIKNYYSVSVKK